MGRNENNPKEKIMNVNKKSGFTLLEIIVVIIIVGVLASLALPQFFSTVEYSRSSEALSNLMQIRTSMEGCRMGSNNSFAGCDVTNIDIPDPTNTPGARFGYATPTVNATDFVAVATRNTVEGGDGTSTITLTVDLTTTPAVSRSGTGAYAGIR